MREFRAVNTAYRMQHHGIHTYNIANLLLSVHLLHSGMRLHFIHAVPSTSDLPVHYHSSD